MDGNICGVDSAVRDQPLAALVNPLTTDSDAFSVWTCVRNCDETNNPDDKRFAVLYGSTDCQLRMSCAGAAELGWALRELHQLTIAL